MIIFDFNQILLIYKLIINWSLSAAINTGANKVSTNIRAGASANIGACINN